MPWLNSYSVNLKPVRTQEAGSRTCTEVSRNTQDLKWTGIRRDPCASRRAHYWLVHACPGAKRKTTGVSEGDCSQALPRGRPGDFDLAGQRTIGKRDRTRCRGVRGEASIPGHTRSQGY